MDTNDQGPTCHDLATVRIFEMPELIEVHFSRSDTSVMAAVRKLRGRWDPTRRAWRIASPPQAHERAISAIRSAVLANVPPIWARQFERLANFSCVTRKFNLAFGAGGVRIRLPAGHRHEFTFRNKVKEAELEGREWVIPARIVETPLVNGILKDVLADDRVLFEKCVGYLDGYAFSGRINFKKDAGIAPALVVGQTVYALPEFIPAADSKLEQEPLRCHAFSVKAAKADAEGATVDLLLLTGDKGYEASAKFARNPNPPFLDVHHIDGKWRRHRI